MLVSTLSRSVAKIEQKIFNPDWLRPVLDDVPDGFLLELNDHISYVNAAYSDLLNYRQHEIQNQHLSVVVAPEDAPRLIEFGHRRVKSEPAPREYDFLARKKDGTQVRLMASVSASTVDRCVLIATVARPFYPSTSTLPREDGEQMDAAQNHVMEVLSRRELEVMERILAGKRAKEIALELSIDYKTVCSHRGRMMRKLHLHDNRELFQYALRHGIIDWS